MADAARSNGTAQGKPEGSNFNFIDFLYKNRIAVAVVAVLAMFIIPLPTVLLDVFLTLNLVLSILVLLIVLYNKKPTDFSLFPTTLLIITVFSLALNVSSTRAILTQGGHFNGRMIKAFATFVVGSSGTSGIVVGAIIFFVFIMVELLVITKGATRVSEVAARFSLDGMPQKQMSIDAEYSSGAISQEEATARKKALQSESDFYGSMDGASKFISGNVKVGILIVVIDVIGGMIIGMAIHGEPLAQAAATYTSFTIGDGLLAQLPALLISVAMGIVVTRAAAPGDISEQISIQFTRDARAYGAAAGVLFGMALIPGFPKYVLIPMAVFFGFYAYKISQVKKKEAGFADMMAKTGEGAKKQKDEKAEIPQMDPPDNLSLELGYGLIPLVDKEKGAELLERMQGMRRQIALDMGIVIPKIRIIDNVLLGSSEYCFKIRGVDVGKSTIRMGYYLCINPGTVKEEISGEKTRDPAFGLPAIWLGEERRGEAERAGYTVVDPPSIIATHLTDIIKHHAAELLDRQNMQNIIDSLRKDYSAVVDEVLMGRDGKGLTIGGIQKVFQGLLKEQVSIRNKVSILESIADFWPVSSVTWFLVEKARQALASQICHQFADEDRVLHVLTIDPVLEQKIFDSKVQNNSGEVFAALEPTLQNAWIRALGKAVGAVRGQSYYPVLLCSQNSRYIVRAALERELPEVAVISFAEIALDYKIESIGIVKLE